MASQGLRKADISTDVFTSNMVFGQKKTGNDFGLVALPTSRVQEVEFYCGKSAIGQMVLRKMDGTTITIGTTRTGDPQRWTFGADDRIESVIIYTMKSQLAGMVMRTKGGRELSVFASPDWKASNCQANRVDPGTGEWVGVFGDAGTWVESLGVAMRK